MDKLTERLIATSAQGKTTPAPVISALIGAGEGPVLWYVPEGVTSICVVCVGGGGSGGNGLSDKAGTNGGGGGGGGALAYVNNIPVTPNEVLYVYPGLGGRPPLGGNASRPGFDGTDSYITRSNGTVLCLSLIHI